jgi:penicillin amidase
MEEFLKVAQKAFPSYEGTENFKEIDDKVEVLWDKWGIPHIFSQSIKDAYFTAGLVHSQDRLWQMESMRRLISGSLSEIFGRSSIESDKHYRTLGLHRIARKFANILRSKENSIMLGLFNSYIDGVNVGIRKSERNPPLEFNALNFTPEEWNLEDSFKIMSYIDWGLSSWNYPLEILRDLLISKLGKEKANQLVPLYDGVSIRGGIGSNGWAISPEKSKSNSSLLANDPHLPLTLPAIWYLMHIVCPSFNVIGVTLPGLPLIILGHNEKLAWGCTNVHADTVDLFELELNPNSSRQYRYNDSWIVLQLINEPIKFKNETGKLEKIDYQVSISKFGPLVKYYELDGHLYEIGEDKNYALRWSSYDGNLINTLEGFFDLNRARNWSEFKDSLKKLTINPQNFIYSDIEGNIGHQQGGMIPVRNYGDGATITPGIKEKYDWRRFSEFEELVSIFNPELNYVFTANFNEDKKPRGLLLAQDRDDPYRQKRLKNLLEDYTKISLEDFIKFQSDYFSEEAAQFLPFILEHLNLEEYPKEKKEIISILQEWDYHLTEVTVAGTLFKVWIQEILKEILVPKIGKNLFYQFLGARPFELDQLFEMYDKKELSNLLEKTFERVLLYLRTNLGEDRANWKWGSLHELTLNHPLSAADENARVLNIGPFPIGGDAYTLNNGYYDPLNEFNVIVGPSFRQIHDLSDWNKSLWIIPGGQSGLPFHRHYDDLIKLWLKTNYIPMLYEIDKIKENLDGKVILNPI